MTLNQKICLFCLSTCQPVGHMIEVETPENLQSARAEAEFLQHRGPSASASFGCFGLARDLQLGR